MRFAYCALPARCAARLANIPPRLPEARRRAQPAPGGRAQARQRILAVQLVELNELVGELVAERDLVVGPDPFRARTAAGQHLDGERPLPGIEVAQPVGDAFHDSGHAGYFLEQVKPSLRLAVDDLVCRALLVRR